MISASEATLAPSPATRGTWHELPWIEPETAFLALRDRRPAFLDSRGPIGERSRFSLLAWQPFRKLRAENATVLRDGKAVPLDPFAALAQEIAALQQAPARSPLPFPPGLAIGFLGYELPQTLHPASAHALPPGMPSLAFGFYRNLLGFDRHLRRAWLATENPAEARDVRRALNQPCATPPPPALHWRHETSRATHDSRIRAAQAYIEAGDIYQANITARASAPRPPNLDVAALHLALARASPAPFAAFLDAGPDLAIASASPERLVRLTADGRIEARPIKGTRPRGETPEHDAAFARALLASSKDRAENLMIADLLRHDIGRVAEIGSIRVPALCALETFPRIHHLVSAIEARLRPGLGAVDLLRALHPGGSITGAPKRRAMQIIAELEPVPRGPYCGTLAWIGFDGAMDASILIRTLVLTRHRIFAHAGGGIVADSDPADEYAEMRLKLAPLLAAFTP